MGEIVATPIKSSAGVRTTAFRGQAIGKVP